MSLSHLGEGPFAASCSLRRGILSLSFPRRRRASCSLRRRDSLSLSHGGEGPLAASCSLRRRDFLGLFLTAEKGLLLPLAH